MAPIEETARAMYEKIPISKPGWDALGEATKSVWRERAQALALPTEAVEAPLAPQRAQTLDLI